MTAAVLALCIFAAVFIRWAVNNDRLAALERLDDEPLAAEASAAWNRKEWS